MFTDFLLEGDVKPRPGLIELIMSLFVAGTCVAVVTKECRAHADPFVKHLVGDGMVNTIVAIDDVVDSAHGDGLSDQFAFALWELGIPPESALAVVGSEPGLASALAAGLATVVVYTDYTAGQNFNGAAAMRSGYGGVDPLLMAGCERLHRSPCVAKQHSGSAVTALNHI